MKHYRECEAMGCECAGARAKYDSKTRQIKCIAECLYGNKEGDVCTSSGMVNIDQDPNFQSNLEAARERKRSLQIIVARVIQKQTPEYRAEVNRLIH